MAIESFIDPKTGRGDNFIVSIKRTEVIRRKEGFHEKGLLTALTYRNEGNVSWLIDTALEILPGEVYTYVHDTGSIEAVSIQVQPNLNYVPASFVPTQDNPEFKPEPFILIVRTKSMPELVTGFDNLRNFFFNPQIK